jgi:tRNA 2-thiouridine synthesizing protein E
MKNIEFEGTSFPVDEEGFLLSPELWGPAWVELVRQSEDIDEITEEHHELMHLLREYNKDHGHPPRVRDMTQVTGFKLKLIYELFPSGPGKGACKMAGLAKPEGCA